MRRSCRQGFTLVELSIVLVILGLLTGGILTGQSLIRAAELRSVGTQYQNFISSMNTFRDKYRALPGDMKTATSFWTTAVNGDGDGQIEQASAAATAGEAFGAWQQLALAGLIEGSYSGTSGALDALDSNAGTNVPTAKLNSGGWSLEYLSTQLITSLHRFEGSYGNILYFGTKIGNETYRQGIIKPEEIWNIDTKMDDGRPGYGNVRALEVDGHATTGCTNPAPAATATANLAVYDFDNTANACAVLFSLGF